MAFVIGCGMGSVVSPMPSEIILASGFFFKVLRFDAVYLREEIASLQLCDVGVTWHL